MLSSNTPNEGAPATCKDSTVFFFKFCSRTSCVWSWSFSWNCYNVSRHWLDTLMLVAKTAHISLVSHTYLIQGLLAKDIPYYIQADPVAHQLPLQTLHRMVPEKEALWQPAIRRPPYTFNCHSGMITWVSGLSWLTWLTPNFFKWWTKLAVCVVVVSQEIYMQYIINRVALGDTTGQIFSPPQYQKWGTYCCLKLKKMGITLLAHGQFVVDNKLSQRRNRYIPSFGHNSLKRQTDGYTMTQVHASTVGKHRFLCIRFKM